jgi:hypothetical protein
MKLILRNEIYNLDTLDNISADCIGIIQDIEWWNEGPYWIEILENGYFVPDGWEGFKTNNLIEAINFLNSIKE